MKEILQSFITNWGINSGVMDVNGIRWRWALHEDPRFPNQDDNDYYISDDDGYYY